MLATLKKKKNVNSQTKMFDLSNKSQLSNEACSVNAGKEDSNLSYNRSTVPGLC